MLLVGAKFAIEFAKENPVKATALGCLILSPFVVFVSLQIRAHVRRKRESELRYITETQRRMAEERAAVAITEASIDVMSGEQLELYLERVFSYLGFEVQHTGRRGDQGADLLLTKNGRRIACQCKRYSHPVNNKAVQEALAAKSYYRCEKSLVVTNSTYTKSAYELAERSGCELIDRRRLGMIVAAYREDRLDKRNHLTTLLGLQAEVSV
jgi:restriction system protein